MHNRLSEFDFNKSRFTLFDHRRLTVLLVKLNPSRYKEGDRPFSIHPDIANFLTQIYSIKEEDYWKKCIALDEKHRLRWWDAILTKHKIVP